MKPFLSKEFQSRVVICGRADSAAALRRLAPPSELPSSLSESTVGAICACNVMPPSVAERLGLDQLDAAEIQSLRIRQHPGAGGSAAYTVPLYQLLSDSLRANERTSNREASKEQVVDAMTPPPRRAEPQDAREGSAATSAAASAAASTATSFSPATPAAACTPPASTTASIIDSPTYVPLALHPSSERLREASTLAAAPSTTPSRGAGPARRGAVLLSGEFVKQGQAFPWTWRARRFEITADAHDPRRLRLAYYDALGVRKGGFEVRDAYIPYEELPSSSLYSYVFETTEPEFRIVFEAADGVRQLLARAASEAEREQWRTAVSNLLDSAAAARLPRASV